MYRWTLAGLALCIGLAFCAPASAEETLDPGRLDPTLKGAPFGGSKDDVLRFLKARVGAHFDNLIRNTMDVRDRDRLMREKDAEIAQVGTDQIAFDGKASGWTVSVIRSEFTENRGEEMIHVRDGDQHLYFFFAKGVFYKLVRAGGGRPMADELEALVKAYGAPAKKDVPDPKHPQVVKSATWGAGLLTLRVEDQSRMFQCATVRWAVKGVDEAGRAAAGGPADAKGLSPLIQQAQDPTGRDEVDPVDDLLGSKPAVPAPAKKGKKKAR